MHVVQVDEGLPCPHVPDDNGIITACAKQISHRVREADAARESRSPTGAWGTGHGKKGAGDERLYLLGRVTRSLLKNTIKAAPGDPLSTQQRRRAEVSFWGVSWTNGARWSVSSACTGEQEKGELQQVPSDKLSLSWLPCP